MTHSSFLQLSLYEIVDSTVYIFLLENCVAMIYLEFLEFNLSGISGIQVIPDIRDEYGYKNQTEYDKISKWPNSQWR